VPMPDPNKFKHFVTLQFSVEVRNGIGGVAVKTWPDQATFWAQVKPISSSQRMFAMRQEVNTTHKITMRFRSDIAIGDISKRIIWEGRTFPIQGHIDIDERKCFLELLCVEGAAS